MVNPTTIHYKILNHSFDSTINNKYNQKSHKPYSAGIGAIFLLSCLKHSSLSKHSSRMASSFFDLTNILPDRASDSLILSSGNSCIDWSESVLPMGGKSVYLSEKLQSYSYLV